MHTCECVCVCVFSAGEGVYRLMSSTVSVLGENCKETYANRFDRLCFWADVGSKCRLHGDKC